jgi:hypothetical protein
MQLKEHLKQLVEAAKPQEKPKEEKPKQESSGTKR